MYLTSSEFLSYSNYGFKPNTAIFGLNLKQI